MKMSEAQYELIEAYLNNELSPADRLSFESDLRADDALRKEVDRQAELRLGLRGLAIRRAVEQARRQYKNQTDPELTSSTAAPVRPLSTAIQPLWRNWMAIAASIAVVLTVGYYVYQEVDRSQTDIALANTLTPDSADELVKSFPKEDVPANTRTQFLDALTNYKAGKYDRAIEQLRTLPADKKTVYYRSYFLGLSHLANRQPEQAIPLFRQAAGTPSARLRQKTEWFLALAYVKADQPEQARPLLQRISADNTHPFHDLARQVLRKIS